VPSPGDPSIGIVGKYQAALQASMPDAKPNFVSLEGYIVGRLMVVALDKIPGEITRQALLDTIAATGSFDLGGMRLVYGPSNNRGSSDVFLTVIQPDGSFKQIQRLAKAGG